jgi:hypothetical protein
VTEEPKVQVFARGLLNVPGVEDEFPDGPPSAVVTHRGCRLILRFANGDLLGEGDVEELRLLPGKLKLKPKTLRQFAPDAELYLAYTRAAMRILEPKETAQERREKWDRFRDSAEALRDNAGPGRGLPPRFFESIAEEYRALVDGGEPHPVKTISKKHVVTISAASRWVTEAERRGFLKKKRKKGGEKGAR